MSSGLFALRESAVITAGAGTGKTHSLVTLCLHLLGGVGRPQALPAARLTAITFTEKAAAELTARLRARVERLAEDDEAQAGEPELWASARESGTAAPGRAHWQRVRRDLGSAQIGTIHSLCTQILRRNAASAGVAPVFAVLDEVEARALLRESCEAAALAALQDEADSPLRDGAEKLCAELTFRGNGRHARGLTDELMRAVTTQAESGGPLLSGGSIRAALEADERVRRRLEAAVQELAASVRAAPPKKRTDAAERTLSEALAFLDQGAPLLHAAAAGELGAVWSRLAVFTGSRGKSEIGLALAAVKDSLDELLVADAEVRAARLLEVLSALASDAQRRYRERKRRAGALDFDDLTRLAEEVLARDLRVRRQEKQRVGVLLVDEFQDTSRAQLRLLGWLAEPPDDEGTAPAGSGMAGALPIAPGRFVLVGDRKQSIYEFRGADVASAQAFAARALADGARQHVLRRSRRSRPQLVRFCNALFARALEEGGEPFHTPFTQGEDHLEAHRPEIDSAPCAELLRVSATGPDAAEVEARAVARRLAALLAEGAPERVLEADGASERGRPVRGGDVAILLRAFTHVDAYRRALLGRGIPHVVWRGRGFYATREVSDLLALLTLAVDPDDARALATVLRSPFGPVSDEGLLLLARGPRPAEAGQGLSIKALRDEVALASLAPDDAQAAREITALIDRVRSSAKLLGPASLLEEALAASDYVAAAAAGLQGEQAAANVDKLLALARAAELRGDSVAELLTRAQALIDEDAREPDAAVVEERDGHAVRLLTVHAAKGLEFPVVFVPECGAAPAQAADGALLLDPDLGAALRVQGANGEACRGLRGEAIYQRRKERELAQSRRLLYVAATRARELVIFSAREARKGEPWRSWLDELAASPQGPELLRVRGEDELARLPVLQARALIERDPALAEELGAASNQPFLETSASAEIARALRACTSGRAPSRETVVAPVTQVADAILCPRRYQLLHELGLPEHAVGRAGEREAQPGSALPATELGTLAHKLLERVPLAEADPGALKALLREEGADPDSEESRQVLGAVARFLGSPLGMRLKAAKGSELYRELPLSLHLTAEDQGAPELLLRGQIDALLIEPGSALVLDYKHAAAHQSAAYELQLDAYALAVHELVGAALPVRSTLVFLRSPDQIPEARPALNEAGRQAQRGKLLAAAAAIAEGRRSGNFPLVAVDRCRAIACGFLQRCHGRADEPEAKERRRPSQLALFS